ncbi:MAG: putative Ig domain-containing protein, partial [Chthoniobacteraceae bacterium]|nr:putative Ig domain-containing protein [Chthoniobacteraceae bacterium]
ALPTASGDLVEGFVNLVIPDNGWVRIAGELTDQTGTFQLASSIDEVAGVILRPTLGVGYQIAQDGNELILVERRLASLVCSGKESAAAPEFGSFAIDSGSLTTGTVTTVAPVVRTDVPLLNTRPGSKGVIFVDFAGASITDPSWNGGKTVVAAPSTATPASITSIVKAVAEDFAPFDITITTDRDLYAATPAGLRMRAVVTPTNTAAPGTGGVAFIGAWASAGKGFKSDTVCWVFNGGTKVCAETISHEIGHTLGLGHDGLAATKDAAGATVAGQTYFYGHGGGINAPSSWGPIMGAPFSVNLSQWSRGEYARANNKQDDVAVIASDANGFGYISNGSPNAILPASTQSGSFMVNGLLQRATVPDTFAFQTKGGTFTASARPANLSSNVDVQLTLTDDSGATVATSSLPDALSAAVNVTLTKGTYVLAVRSAGTGPKPADGYSTGYSEYGSLGGYVLSGNVSGITNEPMFGSTRDFAGVMGKRLNFPIGVTASSTLSLKDGRLPDGLNLDLAKKVITGTPTDDTDGPVSFVLNAANEFGSVDATFNVTVSDVSAPVVNALGGNGRVYNVINSTSSPWTGEMRIGADGVVRAVAESGSIVNGGSSALRFTSYYNGDPKRASAYYLFSFWWKASTEADQDTVKLRVGGALVNDFVTGRPVQLSGATDWVKQTVRVATGTFPAFEFTYSKDGSLSAGRDRVWMYVDSFGLPPVIVNQPPAVVVSNTATLSTTGSAFVLQAKVDGADSVAWFKDGVTLKDGTSSSGSQISGATTGVLTVLKASGADT